METCAVISVMNNIVQSVDLVTAFTVEEAAKQAEDLFKKACQDTFCLDRSILLSNDTLLQAIEDGYWDSKDDDGPTCISIQIHWPTNYQRAVRPVKVTEVAVQDPDFNDGEHEVNIEIWKDTVSGGIFGIDTSYLEQVRDIGIPSPFNTKDLFDMRDELDYQEPPISQDPDEVHAAV